MPKKGRRNKIELAEETAEGVEADSTCRAFRSRLKSPGQSIRRSTHKDSYARNPEKMSKNRKKMLAGEGQIRIQNTICRKCQYWQIRQMPISGYPEASPLHNSNAGTLDDNGSNEQRYITIALMSSDTSQISIMEILEKLRLMDKGLAGK